MRPLDRVAPAKGEILVRNRAVAVNPADNIIRAFGDVFFPWLDYPFVLGADCAGEVVAVGEGVSRFRVGDRVMGHAVGVDQGRNAAAEGSFQSCTVLLDNMAAPIPDAMAFEAAAVLPLGVSTAACALFTEAGLGLRPPQVSDHVTGGTVLVWGGSSNVGANAIQLATAAGYDVLATASPERAGAALSLGASQVFDRHNPSVVSDIVAALGGAPLSGVVAIGLGSAEPCIDVAGACAGRAKVVMVTPPVPTDDLPIGVGREEAVAAFLDGLGVAIATLGGRAKSSGIETGMIASSSFYKESASRAVYEQYLPRALVTGRYKPSSPAKIVGTDLLALPAALEAMRRGTPGYKLVVSL